MYNKLTDYETLEQILDLFMKSFLKDMNLNNKSNSEKTTAVPSDEQSKRICQIKTNLLDVYAEVLKLSTLDKNIRHFEEYQYHQVMVSSLNSLVTLYSLS